jgi:hypothetical protein
MAGQVVWRDSPLGGAVDAGRDVLSLAVEIEGCPFQAACVPGSIVGGRILS